MSIGSLSNAVHRAGGSEHCQTSKDCCKNCPNANQMRIAERAYNAALKGSAFVAEVNATVNGF